MIEKYIKCLIQMSIKAKNKGEVPVSAILVKNNKIMSKAYNTRIKDCNPLMHAEIKCILKECKRLKDWRLDDYEMYVTLEPCHMCKEIIKECRIKNVYYLIDSEKNVNFKSEFKKIDSESSEEYKKMLISFFHNLR